MFKFRDQAFEDEDVLRLYLRTLKASSIVPPEKKELIQLFRETTNSFIWNRLVLLLSDLNEDDVVPVIIDKIKDEQTSIDNGTLVFSLLELNCFEYFSYFIEILCTMEYEAQMGAMELVAKYEPFISITQRNEAINILDQRRFELELQNSDDSRLNFIDAAIQVLRGEIKWRNEH